MDQRIRPVAQPPRLLDQVREHDNDPSTALRTGLYPCVQ
jgi:hypothetical protein